MNSKNIKKNLFIFFSVIISIFIVTILWNKINLPLNDTIITDEFSNLKSYNTNTDTLRYIIFIIVPLVVFLFLNLKIKKKQIKLNELIYEKNYSVINYQPILLLISLIFFLKIILEFFSLNFVLPDELSNYRFDRMHDGNYLTPTYNFFLTKNFWISSFLVHGGSDIFYTSISWKIFETESIGATRVFNIFFILSIKILCIVLAYQLTKITKLNEKSKILFFTIFAAILISMSAYKFTGGGSSYYFSSRDIYLIVFLIFFIELFVKTKIRYLSTVIICFISAISILLHYDTGIYINFILVLYLLYLIISKRKKDLLIIIFSLFFFWMTLISILGFEEISAFLKNLSVMIASMDLMVGLEYPTPFLSLGENPDAARATRGLLLQLTAGMFVINSIFSSKNKIFVSNRIFFIFLFLLSLIVYKNALGRSDGGHIRNSQDILIIINSFFILNYILIFLQKKILSKKIFVYSSLFFLIFYFSYNNHIKIDSIINYKKNFNNFVKYGDDIFLDNNTVKFISYYKKLTRNDKCVENISFNDAVPYLMKKPSCTKYWASWLASPIAVQKDYINKLKKTRPEFVLYSSQNDKLDGIDIYERIKLVNSFIMDNYDLHEEIYGYRILKRK